MPLVNVKVFADRLDDDTFSEQLTRAITEAVVGVCGEGSRDATWVMVEGVPRSQWSFGGERKL